MNQPHDFRFGYIPYGSVYLIDPELSVEEQRRDLENMKKLGFNSVVLWPPVSRWEGEPYGEIAFGAVDKVMDICAEFEIHALLELMGQNTSFQETPELYERPEQTPRANFRDIPINDPVYNQRIREYFHAVVSHFKGHPALSAYCVFNECGNITRDEPTIRAFIEFLKKQYGNDIVALNKAWGCFFGNFDDIQKTIPPHFHMWRWSSNVGSRDWQRFRAVNYADRIEEWSSWVREDDPDVIVYSDVLGMDTLHNRAGDYYGITDRKIAKRSDVLGLSCYANFLGQKWWEADFWRWAQWWRSARSAAQGKQTMISELMTQNRTLFPAEYSSMTDQIRLWSYQAMFHAIGGLIYWKYRPFRKGLQVSGRGITEYDGTPNHFAEDASRVARFTAKNETILAQGIPDPAGCAILYDTNTQDVFQALQPDRESYYTDAMSGLFFGFWKKGISPMFVQPEDLDENGGPEWIQVMAVPNNISLSRETADKLKAFVRRGGVLLTEARFGLLDEDARLWPDVPGGDLYENFGYRERNISANISGTVKTPEGTDLELDLDYMQLLECGEQAEVILKSTDGKPVLLSSKSGGGMVIHCALLLGAMIFKNRSGALDVFNAAYDLMHPQIHPAAPIVEKPDRTDVSVLTDESGKVTLIGITNYEETEAVVKMMHDSEPVSVEGDPGTTVILSGQILEVTVKPRSAAALVF